MDPVPCVMVAYYDFESVRATTECLLREAPRLSITVLENRSEHTDGSIKPYLLDLVRSGRVARYVLFDRNITNNAFEVALDDGVVAVGRSPYVVLTDGDLTVPDGWLDEELGVLAGDPRVFACGVSLDPSNLPTATFPDAVRWIPPDRGETPAYIEATTGVHLLMCRGPELEQFLRYRRRTGRPFVDSAMHDYAYHVAGQKWCRTKRTIARHLTWDRYADLDHPYTRMKVARSFARTWDHRSYCSYTVYTAGSETRHTPVKKMLLGSVAGAVLGLRRATARSGRGLRSLLGGRRRG